MPVELKPLFYHIDNQKKPRGLERPLLLTTQRQEVYRQRDMHKDKCLTVIGAAPYLQKPVTIQVPLLTETVAAQPHVCLDVVIVDLEIPGRGLASGGAGGAGPEELVLHAHQIRHPVLVGVQHLLACP